VYYVFGGDVMSELAAGYILWGLNIEVLISALTQNTDIEIWVWVGVLVGVLAILALVILFVVTIYRLLRLLGRYILWPLGIGILIYVLTQITDIDIWVWVGVVAFLILALYTRWVVIELGLSNKEFGFILLGMVIIVSLNLLILNRFDPAPIFIFLLWIILAYGGYKIMMQETLIQSDNPFIRAISFFYIGAAIISAVLLVIVFVIKYFFNK
jgi:hypothetical protein